MWLTLPTTGIVRSTLRVVINENSEFRCGLFAQPVPLLIRIELHVVHFHREVRTNTIRGDQVLCVDVSRIAYSNWTIFNDIVDWAPNAMS